MSIIINTNISSMLGVTALNKNTNAMNKALERLSTGCRINSSKDDAAGCAISTSLGKEVSSLNVAQNNAQMGQSMVDTANGALNNMSNMLQRIRDLAEQSANGTYGADERKAMQTEVSNLVNELYRTKNSTEFNGKQILGAEVQMTEAEAEAAGYAVVKTAQELKAKLTTDANCKVMLFADIDLSDLEEVDGSNWTAVGTSSKPFKGTFDGNGFTISNLKINKPDSINQGLFGRTYGATIKNVTLENVDVTGNKSTGGLVGENFNSTIENCTSSGVVTGNSATGGLVGFNYNSSTISNCTSSGTVTGTSYVGGLVGRNATSSTISNCSSTGSVTGNQMTGGLVGENYISSTISNCSSTGSVTGNGNYTGGLVGFNHNNSTISNCSSTGSVTGNGTRTGGLVGENYTNSTISNCSSTGSVTGNGNYTGGLVGYNTGSSTISDSKTTSIVLGTRGATTGAFLGSLELNCELKGNEYNSTINEGMRAIGNVASPTEEQIKDNQELVIDPDEQEQKEINPINLQVGIENDEDSVINVDTGFEMGLFAVNIATEYGARKALAKIDALMTKMTDKQTELGAISARLDSAMQYQAIQKTAKISTNSLIKDADFAAESSNYIKQQILQQTTSSLLSTANQNPNIALMLLNAHRAA